MSSSGHVRIDTRDIPGWFSWTDQGVFEHLLGRQDAEPAGRLVELGAYLGKSAVVLGEYLRDGEELVVCDLFGDDAPDEHNSRENARSYGSLTRRAFEANYLRVHGALPTVVQAPTSMIREHVQAGTTRFVHIDASHLYEHVVGDLEAAREMLRPGGVVVCDDYRSPHTPGVAAAVWSAVVGGPLRPFCLTPSKLYGSFDDPAAHREAVAAWVESVPGLNSEVQIIAGEPVVRVWPAAKPAPAPRKDPVGDKLDTVLSRLDRLDRRLERVERTPAKVGPGRSGAAGGPARRLVRALLPVRLRRAVHRRLHRG